ncbi:phage tail protein [Caenimonas koreensis DSM 17982]|uniref:Phage tail protein n=1 Tax=Caenimonas koreensis DSM 17982 TaxID=1121255 RepID=A0A844BCU0_9BURK|nr:tail fiber protein [Caenimonas koreensis]MRD48321.1 phage tail protein [Caenimonas koreensis DSM 17982]
MSEPFLSEIRAVSFGFAPKGWALCNGQLLAINQNQALFSLLGTTYGGNGQTTFGLPNLQGRVPIHMGAGFTLGERAGETAHTITSLEMPTHNHVVSGRGDTMPATAANSVPTGKTFAGGQVAQQGGQSAALNLYGPYASLVSMSPTAVTNIGGSQPHENMMPYLTLNYIIALQGIFPSQS